jgi:hypothetical protein
MAKKQQRACETVQVESRHKDFAPIGKKVWVTPDEAKCMVAIGRAVKVQQELNLSEDRQPTYAHREMLADRPMHAKRSKKIET